MAASEAGCTGRADSAGSAGAPAASTGDGVSAMVPVQVCYAAPAEQTVIDLMVPPETTLAQAIGLSGMVSRHRDIDLSTQKIGVFGKIRALDDVVSAHDRIEIYRPLIVDPKVARARRVAKTRKGGSIEGRKWVSREAR